MKLTCKDCGEPILPGVDINNLCPECYRLRKEVAEYGMGKQRGSDQHQIGPGSYRRDATNPE